MTTYTDVFGSSTVPPADYGYQLLTLTSDVTLVWPFNTAGGTAVSKIIDVANTSPYAITLPDATQVSTGEDLLIRNVGSDTITIYDEAAAQVTLVLAGAAKYLYLTDNSTSRGTWGVIDYGVGTSSVDAASLVGYGIIASGASLNQSHPVLTTATAPTISTIHRASVVNYTGGTGAIPLSSAATMGDNFFTLIRNSGTGTITLDPAASETIDGVLNLPLQPGESLLLFCSGIEWFSVGYGRSIVYNWSQLVKDVSAAGTFTLSAAEASNKLLTFIGNPAGAVTVIVPDVVAVYYLLSSISTSQTITVKTASGAGVSLPQSQRLIVICDSNDVYSAQSVSATSSIGVIDGSAAAPAVYFSSKSNTGIFKYSSDGVGFSVNGDDVLHLTSTGSSTKVLGLRGATSGEVTLSAPAVAASYAFTLPAMSGALLAAGATQAAGTFDTSVTSPSHTTRLNYDGNFYATAFVGDGSGLTGVGNPLVGGTLTGSLNYATTVSLASASTTNIGAQTSNIISITGAVTINSFGTIAAGATRKLTFVSTPIITHNAVSMILPGAANITAAAGDAAEFLSLGSGNWKCLSYTRAANLYITKALANTAVTGFKTATFNSQAVLSTTTGSVAIDWSAAQNYKQNEPTGAINYSTGGFTAPPGVCHLQLFIDSDGTSTAQTFTWPASVIWLGATWTAVANKKAVINFWYDGTNYYAMGSNQV